MEIVDCGTNRISFVSYSSSVLKIITPYDIKDVTVGTGKQQEQTTVSGEGEDLTFTGLKTIIDQNEKRGYWIVSQVVRYPRYPCNQLMYLFTYLMTWLLNSETVVVYQNDKSYISELSIHEKVEPISPTLQTTFSTSTINKRNTILIIEKYIRQITGINLKFPVFIPHFCLS